MHERSDHCPKARGIMPATLAALRRLIYHPMLSSSPDATLAAARRILGRRDLGHGELEQLSETEGRTLLERLAGRCPDRTGALRAAFASRPS